MVVLKALLSLWILILDLEDMPIFYKNPEIEKSVNFFLYAWLTIVLYAYAWFCDQETAEFFQHQMVLKFKEIPIFRRGAALHAFQIEYREKYVNTFRASWDACPRTRQVATSQKCKYFSRVLTCIMS